MVGVFLMFWDALREPEVLNIVPNTTFRSYAPEGVPWKEEPLEDG